MTERDNPFDTTIWDPANPEQAIEDTLHGPSVVLEMLAVPPMPLGDGTYYQFGGFYVAGTVYFDAQNQPIHMIGAQRSLSEIRREMLQLEEWRDASAKGDDALVELEASRQNERMKSTGVAHCYKPSDVCVGGKRIDQCETAESMLGALSMVADKISQQGTKGGRRQWHAVEWLGKTCASCSLECGVAVETRDGVPTGTTRFTNMKPLPQIRSIHINAIR